MGTIAELGAEVCDVASLYPAADVSAVEGGGKSESWLDVSRRWIR